MGDTARHTSTVHLELEDGYRVRADFGKGQGVLVMDEPAPLGEGSGPNASAVLAAAVANCLSASLVFCLRKAHVEVKSLDAEVDVTTARNERGRLRVCGLQVRLRPVVAPGQEGRVERCLGLFEDFCVVTEAVRSGIDVEVTVDGLPGPAASTERERPAP